MFKIKDFKNGDIVTLRNGDKLLYVDEEFYINSGEGDNSLCDIYDLEDDLTCEDDKNSTIVRIDRPVAFKTIYERAARKMTVSEICDTLGYDVEIVKEDD